MSKLIYRLLVLVVVVIFIILKIPHLDLPYYWDELSPYARGILHLYDHGLSLEPNAMPASLSRGHPLLFYNFYALCFKIFGPTVLVAHAVGLAIASFTLLSLAYTAKRIYGKLPALLSIILMAIQPLFFAQSIFMMPEIVLALCAIWYVYFIFKHQWLMASLIGIIAILTKETGIVLVAFGGLYAMFHGRETWMQFFKNALIILLPLLAWGIFLIVQKQQMGWYLFPYHTGLVTFDGKMLDQFFKGYKTFLFHHQGRYIIKSFLIIGAIVFAFKSLASWRIRLSRPTIWLMVFVALVFAVLVPNAHVLRYILTGFPAFFLLIGLLLSNIPVPKLYKSFAGFIGVAIIAFSVWPYHYPDKFTFDKDMGYLHYVNTSTAAMNYVNTPENEGKSFAGDFLLYEGYKDARMGNVDEVLLRPVALEIEPADFIITSNEGARLKIPNPENYEEVKRFESSFSVTKVLKRK